MSANRWIFGSYYSPFSVFSSHQKERPFQSLSAVSFPDFPAKAHLSPCCWWKLNSHWGKMSLFCSLSRSFAPLDVIELSIFLLPHWAFPTRERSFHREHVEEGNVDWVLEWTILDFATVEMNEIMSIKNVDIAQIESSLWKFIQWHVISHFLSFFVNRSI